MPSPLKLKRASGLNLTLEGSVGRFRIGANGENKSLEVLYLETHIGFDPNVAANEVMLQALEPVRETFDFQDLGFDAIMQRDIDDARVTTELIPYLLDEDSRGTIKFFPPIVVVVLPVQNRVTRPEQYYPKVSRFTEDDEVRTKAEVIRSGEVGGEAFQFEYPITDQGPLQHDLARLKLNTNKVRLVIIDGQHRAMALLAIYRNLRGEWNDARRMPFRSYYREWTKSRILGFDLKELQLPVIVCTYPDLDTDFKGDFDIIRAARNTFLTLNKTARLVSVSYNILLDDRDIISHFLRDTLQRVKQKDLHSGSSMRIWNVELDQYRDRTKIESPVACTGVSHVYYSIEHMLLDDNDVKGIGARSGKFYRRAWMEGSLLRRLNGENLLGRETAASLKRHTYSLAVARTLADEFHKRYGQFLIGAFDTFRPFETHNKACLEIETSLQGHINPQIRNILFEGQNIGRTFADYLAHMQEVERKAKDSNWPLAPEIQAVLATLRGTEQAVAATRQSMKNRRAELFVGDIPDKSKLRDADDQVSKQLRKLLDDLYDEVFFSVAFQAALVFGYFLVVEKAERLAKDRGATLSAREATFPEYIDSLNSFFAPATMAKLKHLLKAFFYDVEGERAEEWKQVPTETFNTVVFRGEMKPDEWPKYRYLLLELWRTADPILEEVRKAERDLCRQQAFKSLYDRRARDYSADRKKNEQDLTEVEWKEIFDRSYEAFDEFLRNLGLKQEERISTARAKEVVARPLPAVAEAEEAALS